ncbi:MAG: hypothetical protein H5U40_17720 [Polyangiaceae bacterium]|nr:hypothetical protein [Polyangiaceae bacterium]
MALRLSAGLEEETFRQHRGDWLVQTPHALELPPIAALPAAIRRALEATIEPKPLYEILHAIEDGPDAAPDAGYRTLVLLLHLDALRWIEG